jgi:Flp pilus assembly protein TadG
MVHALLRTAREESQQMTRKRFDRSERGAIAALSGIVMLALASMVVVGVDLGRLAFTASEVQSVADAAANAYAIAMQRDRDDPQADAQQVVAGNSIDGAAALPANIEAFELGNYSSQSLDFVPGGNPANAVRATATATVDNFFAGLVGDPATTVRKRSTAAIGCPGAGRFVLPIVVGECAFAAFESSDDCSDLPELIQQPVQGDNSCWTNLMSGPGGGASTTISYLPTSCCQGGNCGGGVPGPQVQIGDVLYHTNGQSNSVMHILEDCVEDDGITDYVVPIVACDSNLTNCVGTSPIVGFASVRVTHVDDQGSEKSIDLEFFCNDNDPVVGDTTGFSDECFGTTSVAMVE